MNSLMTEKLLLADDEPGIRKVLGLTLIDRGYHVLTAENGEEALKVFKRERPSIVFTDIKMPGMDGIELLRKIKQADPETEVIMISGHGDMDLAIQSLKFDATDFVTKPISDDALDIALKRAEDKLTLRRQLREYTENLERMVKEKSAKLVELERLTAIHQAVDGFSSAMSDIAGNIDGGLQYFNEMPCLISIHDRDLKVVAANSLYKQRVASRLGSSSWQNFTGSSRSPDRCPVGLTFQSGKGQRRQETIRYLNGLDYPVIVHTAPIRNTNGEIELVLEVSADISEVRRLQEELEATQQKFQLLFDEVPCYISVQDRSFKITAANRRFKEDFGDAISSHCYGVYRNRAQVCPDCPVELTFKDGQSHLSEMVVRSKTGQELTVLIQTSPIRRFDGEITQVMEMATDITQIRHLQTHLSTLGLMVGTISHSIKGVLTGLDAGLYFLESGLKKDSRHQVEEGVEVVKLMGERIRNVVLNILYYAKERSLKWEKIDVVAFLTDVAAMITPKTEGLPIDLALDFRQPLGMIELDPVLIRTALINILENAVDACMDEDSAKPSKIRFGARQDNGKILIEIEDNGSGMARETAEKAFSLFFSSKGHTGTGLGLFIAQRIIQQHGGSIDVESDIGSGSLFSIRLLKVLPEPVKTGNHEATQGLLHCP